MGSDEQKKNNFVVQITKMSSRLEQVKDRLKQEAKEKFINGAAYAANEARERGVSDKAYLDAINIGHNFHRLMRGESPIKAMTEEEVAFHRARMCLDCSD